MGMALKADVSEACKLAGTAKPVDLVHLSRQTMGDRELEKEVLGIFLSQSQTYIQQLENAVSDDEKMRSAHRLKGAARGIGAWDLANLAEAAEQGMTSDCSEINAEIGVVCSYIMELRSLK